MGGKQASKPSENTILSDELIVVITAAIGTLSSSGAVPVIRSATAVRQQQKGPSTPRSSTSRPPARSSNPGFTPRPTEVAAAATGETHPLIRSMGAEYRVSSGVPAVNPMVRNSN